MDQELERVQPGTKGIRRRVAGRGFSYVSANGRRIHSDRLLERINALAIPPAWTQVWIASAPSAHIQATGVDAAGRLQYIYHPRWRQMREHEKFIRSLAFAQRLPTIRRGVTRDLKQERDPRLRALAAAVRLMDRAGLRVGGAAYAQENGSFGATTLLKRHLSLEGDTVHLRFRGKSAGDWDVALTDKLLAAYFAALPHTPRSGPAICHAVPVGRRKEWKPVSDGEVNAYLGEVAGHGFTAKDFRTWQGTVVAALSLARSLRAGATSPEAVTAAIDEAAQWLHNTPAVARGSYVNPRLIDLFERGVVADPRRQPDRAVLALLMEGDGEEPE
ncbi:MAG: DNA topoisomerase IB [Paeniglutamicibacter sp.]